MRPEPTAHNLIRRYQFRHLAHGAARQPDRPDGSQVYQCNCGERLVVTAAQIRDFLTKP